MKTTTLTKKINRTKNYLAYRVFEILVLFIAAIPCAIYIIAKLIAMMGKRVPDDIVGDKSTKL